MNYYSFIKAEKTSMWTFKEDSPSKPKYKNMGSALGTLKDLETYTKQFCYEQEKDKLVHLKLVSQNIVNRYQSGKYRKVVNTVKRFFGFKVELDEIRAINNKIQNYTPFVPFNFQSLPSDIQKEMLNKWLPIELLKNVIVVDKSCRIVVKKDYYMRAKKFGYVGDEEGAATYLSDLSHVTELAKKSYGFPESLKNLKREVLWNELKLKDPIDREDSFITSLLICALNQSPLEPDLIVDELQDALQNKDYKFQRFFFNHLSKTYIFEKLLDEAFSEDSYFKGSQFLITKIGMNTVNDEGLTVLDKAIKNKNFRVVQWLVDQGVNLRQGYPLHEAVTSQDYKIVNYLLSAHKSPDIHLKDKNGNDPLTLAKLNNRDVLIVNLIETEISKQNMCTFL